MVVRGQGVPRLVVVAGVMEAEKAGERGNLPKHKQIGTGMSLEDRAKTIELQVNWFQQWPAYRCPCLHFFHVTNTSVARRKPALFLHNNA